MKTHERSPSFSLTLKQDFQRKREIPRGRGLGSWERSQGQGDGLSSTSSSVEEGGKRRKCTDRRSSQPRHDGEASLHEILDFSGEK